MFPERSSFSPGLPTMCVLHKCPCSTRDLRSQRPGGETQRRTGRPRPAAARGLSVATVILHPCVSAPGSPPPAASLRRCSRLRPVFAPVPVSPASTWKLHRLLGHGSLITSWKDLCRERRGRPPDLRRRSAVVISVPGEPLAVVGRHGSGPSLERTGGTYGPRPAPPRC